MQLPSCESTQEASDGRNKNIKTLLLSLTRKHEALLTSRRELTLRRTPSDWPSPCRRRWFPAFPFLLDSCVQQRTVYLSKRVFLRGVASPTPTKRIKTGPWISLSPFMQWPRVAYSVVDARWVSPSFSRPFTERPRFSLLLDSRGVSWKDFSSVELELTVSLWEAMETQEQLPPFGIYLDNNKKTSPELLQADRLGVCVRRVQHHVCQLLD